MRRERTNEEGLVRSTPQEIHDVKGKNEVEYSSAIAARPGVRTGR